MAKKKKNKQKRAPKTKALARIEQPRPLIIQGSRQRELKREEINLLKRTVAKGTSDDEFALFLWVARKHRLDPMTRQLHCVMRNVSKHHQDEKGIWVSGQQMTIQIGIDGYRSLAARDHKDFGGCDEPEFEMSKEKTPTKASIPDKASIRLWKKGHDHPIVGVAYWEEYAPKDLTEPKCFMWARMPRHMLAKCAEAIALRKGFPELSDIYTDEEMAQADQDFTPGGRRILEADGSSPSGLPAEVYSGGSKAAADAVAARKIAEHAGKAKNAIGADSRPSGEPMDQAPKKSEIVYLTAWKPGLTALSGLGLSIVRSEMFPDEKEALGIKCYDGSVFCVPETKSFDFMDACKRIGVATEWKEPAKPVQTKEEPTNPTLPRAKIPPAPAFPDQPAPARSTDPILFEAKVIEAQGKKPFMALKWDGKKPSTFDKGLWPILLAAIGKPVMLETREKGQYSNLIRIIRVDGVIFEEEPKKPKKSATLF